MSRPQTPDRINVISESPRMPNRVMSAPRNKVDHLESLIVRRILAAL